MLFKATHINQAGHRRLAKVTAVNVADAIDQMEREFGEARALACVRLATRPVLRLVPPQTRRQLCAA